jgi:AAA+ ATPase superfamily predicted ATPase
MLTPELIEMNPNFIGREEEIRRLSALKSLNEAAIVIMYGRRRVGKTELLEQVFRDRALLKFEGLENEPEEIQRQQVLNQLSRYANDPLIRRVKTENWQDVFELIYEHTQTGTWTIYFEEVQWLANYEDIFVKYLKVAWDNHFRRNPNIVLILCGSSPSFMVNEVVRSKALHNRSHHEFHLKELSLRDSTKLMSGRSFTEVLDAYLTLGGIPEYLKRLKRSSSLFLGICQESFLPKAYFSTEYERIFVSTLAESSSYRKIIEALSQERFMTRDELALKLDLSSGGRLTEVLEELRSCGFIDRYVPYYLEEGSTLGRYAISDSYLHFFFRFIHPILKEIQSGAYQDSPVKALTSQAYQQYLGYAFERFCCAYAHQIAKLLGFSAVSYRSGSFFNRSSGQGYQIDLLFDRKDKVVTVCEIKYRQTKIGTEVIAEFEQKLARFLDDKKTNKSLHKVLIAPFGGEDALINRHYFDQILTLEDLKFL